MNKMKHIGMVLFVGTMFLGFSVGLASADNLSDIVFNDGRVINTSDMIEGSESLSAAPFEGTAIDRLEALIDQGVSLEAPDVEAIANLEPATSGIDTEGAEVVLGGWDTRTRHYTTDYPANAVVLITSSIGVCTGWLTGPNTVITAGHCVHSGGPGGSWGSNFVVYPGYDQGSPYGSCGWVGAASVLGWVNNRNEKFDYGAIKLNCTVGNTTGWFGFTKKRGKKKDPTRITGYPGDKPRWTQWESADHVKVKKSKQVFYPNDTAGGMSGSPVWFDNTGNNIFTNGPYAFAIHAYGTHGSGPHNKYNHGTLINKSVYNNILFWRNTWMESNR